MKKKIKAWLDKLAAANAKSFGTGPLNCCDLSKQQNTTKNK